MHVVRYVPPGSSDAPVVGVREGERVTPLPDTGSVAELLRLSTSEIRGRLDRELADTSLAISDVRLMPPIDGRTEVWASGVTYERSRGARVEESSDGDIYRYVYDAPRPELFFKAPAWRVVTDGEPVVIRSDSPLNVPEPELALVVNAHGEIVGVVVCNDMSSRSLEGENPLYLPQAKIYNGSCALSASIRPVWTMGDLTDLRIHMRILRDGSTVWSGDTTTGKLRRGPRELVDALFAETDFPDGAVLATGTGIIPEIEFVLSPTDRIEIAIDGLGVLSNHVVRGRDSVPRLDDSSEDRNAKEALR